MKAPLIQLAGVAVPDFIIFFFCPFPFGFNYFTAVEYTFSLKSVH